MLQHNNNKLLHKTHTWITLISMIIILTSLAIYIARLNGIVQPTRISHAWNNITINTTICFFLAGLGLWLINYKSCNRWSSTMIGFIATSILLISSMALIEYLTDIDLTIDELIKSHPFSGRMTISTAVNFILIALCFFIRLKQAVFIWIMQTLIWLMMLITITALFLYVYKTHTDTIFGVYAIMPVPTILLFLLLGIGLLLTKPEAGTVGILLKKNFTGHFLRRLIIIPIFFPIALIQIVVSLNKAGVIAYSTEMVMLQVGFLTLTGLMIAVSSKMLDHKERELRKSQSQVVKIRTKAIKQVRHFTQHDFLTGLLNRTSLEKKLDKLISDGEPKFIAILVLNIDKFKLIIETLGLEVSDTLVKVVATRLRSLSEHNHASLARLEGDKFSVSIPVSDKQAALNLAEMIHHEFKESLEFNHHKINLSISIGISMYPKDGLDGHSLILHAALAMFDANRRGGNGTVIFTNVLPEVASKKIAMYIELHQAITNSSELLLVYQPQVNLKSNQICAAEALVRWQHPLLGLIFPTEFIPFAEKNNLIVPLNELIMRMVFEQISLLELKIPVSINISAQQFEDGFEFVDYMQSLMSEFKINAEWIGLELTENMLVEDTEHNIAILSALRNLGFQISIDDFGTGFSSFSYLQRLPVHKIKIDKSFISGLPSNTSNVKIVKSIIALAHSLDIIVVAEGAETKAEVEFLKQENCDIIQGFYYYKPMSFNDLDMTIQSKTPN